MNDRYRPVHSQHTSSKECHSFSLNQQRTYSISAKSPKQRHRVFIALGSNMGDRFDTIERACRHLDVHDSISVRRTSGLWETKAMYVVDQADFLNGVCEVETTLEPLELLDELQAIEIALDRKKVIDKGPRTIDLDILLYDDLVFDHERLTVPHKLMLERAFVLQPLCQLIPEETHPKSSSAVPYSHHLANLPTPDKPASTLTPLSPTLDPISSLLPTRKTHIMSILNVTPDSFSDGGINSPTDLPTLHATIATHLSSGATIIDVGGQSTRPNAPIVSAEEETARVLPAIQHLNSLLTPTSTSTSTSTTPSAPPKAAISIDTFRASVARAAVKAGAHIINDVSGGTLDPSMLPTMASLNTTVILMHMRGNPSTMSHPPHTHYPNGLIPTIGAELASRVRAAEAAGIRRWRILLDPGIGFAKTGPQNLEVLRRMGELRAWPGLEGLPWVLGASRKGFIGRITGVVEARERREGSGVAVVAGVVGGVDVVRVHDVEETRRVVRMAEAVWRV